ncbi:unnamed protein product [Pylaiella littoralis]
MMMHFSPRLITTMALAAPRLALALRVRGMTTTAAATDTTIGGRRRSSSSSTSSSSGSGGVGGDTCSIVSVACHFLEDKKRLIECLSPADYSAVDPAVGASVGGHMRHALDHFSKCLTAAHPSAAAGGGGGGAAIAVTVAADEDDDDNAAPISDATTSSSSVVTIRYDQRVRGGSIEMDPAAASQFISLLLQQLRALPQGTAELRAMRVAPTFMVVAPGIDGGREEHEFESNLERELFFCCHHGTHHDAMIQLILRSMGEKGEIALSQAGKGFGVAPSTVDFRRKQEEEKEKREG